MGVKGLTSFLEDQKSDKYHNKVEIQNCIVIMDGDNLKHFLYSPMMPLNGHKRTYNSRNHSFAFFGGDHLLYAKNIRYFFQTLRASNITSLVIFDGASEEIKMNTVGDRYAERTKTNVKEGAIHPGRNYHPIMKTVLNDVLKEMGISFYQVKEEADFTISLIAKKLGDVIILSDDSDFQICQNETVPFRNMTAIKSPRYGNISVRGRNVSLWKVCRDEYNIKDAKLLVLLSVICGNDWISNIVFQTFFGKEFGTISKPHEEESDDNDDDDKKIAEGNSTSVSLIKPKQSKPNGEKLSSKMRISKMLNWLSEQKTYERAVETLLSIKRTEESKAILRQLIQKISNTYDGLGADEKLWELILKDENISTNKLLKRLRNNPNEDNWRNTTTPVSKITNNPKESVGSWRPVFKPKVKREEALETDFELLSFSQREVSELQSMPLQFTPMGKIVKTEPKTDEDIALTGKRIKTIRIPVIEIPEWFMDCYYRAKMRAELMDLILSRFIKLESQVEICSLSNSHDIAIPLIKVYAGMLLSKSKFIIVTRNGNHMDQVETDTVTSLPKFGDLPNLQNTVEPSWGLDQENRQLILLETLGLLEDNEFITKWPRQMRLWIACLLYYVRTSKSANSPSTSNADTSAGQQESTFSWKMNESIAISVLISIISLGMCNADIDNPQNAVIGESPNVKILHLMKKHLDSFKILDYYRNINAIDTNSKEFLSSYDIRRGYEISKFVCLLYHATSFNSLLDDPFDRPKQCYHLNTQFVYLMSQQIDQDFPQEIRSRLLEQKVGRKTMEIINQFLKTVGNVEE